MSNSEREMPGDTLTRNSWFRRLSHIPRTVARGVLTVNKDVDPNLVTIFGGVFDVDASIKATRLNSDGKVHFRASLPILGEYLASKTCDWFDGSLATEKNKTEPGSHDTRFGGTLDAVIDKFGNLGSGIARIIIAHRKGDRYGESIAAVATSTHPLSAYFRSEGETKGEEFPESGSGIKRMDILGFVGTQLGRNALTIGETLWGNAGIKVKGRTVTFQNAADTLSAASNIKTAIVRARGGQPIRLPSKDNMEEYEKAVARLNQIKKDAEFRQKGLLLVLLGTAAAVVVTEIVLHHKNKNKETIAAGVKELNWDSPELHLPRPDSFPTVYAPAIGLPSGLAEQVSRISGGHFEKVFVYGSTVSGVATDSSRIDLWGIARKPEDFYRHAARRKDVKLGTFRSPKFHSWWNKRKSNFYLGNTYVDGFKRGIKLGVIGHDEFLKHARGGRPDAMKRGEGKGRLWVAGRFQKAAFVPLLTETTPAEQQELDLAINQARIDGVWLALGLLPHNFTYGELAEKYTNLSYAADGRIEGGDKSKSLLHKNYELYQEMLGGVLGCFVDAGIIREVEGKPGSYEKVMSLPEEAVKECLRKAKRYAVKVNVPYNMWTMGPIKGLIYEFEKIKRVAGRSLRRRFKK